MSDQPSASEQHRGSVPTPSDDPEVSSDATPDAAELEISRAEAVEMARQNQLRVEEFEQGIQG